jgi:hypothetical protein
VTGAPNQAATQPEFLAPTEVIKANPNSIDFGHGIVCVDGMKVIITMNRAKDELKPFKAMQLEAGGTVRTTSFGKFDYRTIMPPAVANEFWSQILAKNGIPIDKQRGLKITEGMKFVTAAGCGYDAQQPVQAGKSEDE